MLRKTFLKVSSVFPRSVVEWTGTLMIQAGYAASPRIYLGSSLILSILLSIIAFQVSARFLDFTASFIVSLMAFLLIGSIFILMLIITADKRARKVEEVLPDALQMMSANVRAGMTIENAILMSARPEFGPLEEEIRRISSKSFGGVPITEGLLKMSERVRSSVLERAVKLLIEGISMGGEMAPLLDEVARDIKAIRMLKQEIRNATTMYTIFIVFTAVIASPALFSLSLFYCEISAKLAAAKTAAAPPVTELSGAGARGLSTKGLTKFLEFGARREKMEMITPDDIKIFAIECIILTNFMASLTLAQIRYGKLTAGIKYIPIFVVDALLAFFIAHSLLTIMFRGFMQF